MAIDEDTDTVIYLVKCVGESSFKIIDYKNKIEKPFERTNIEQLKGFKPRFIRVVNNQIFIINLCCALIDQNNRERVVDEFGGSLIYIFDKNLFKLKMKIDLEKYTMYQPWNLIVDKDSNIYTTVSEIKEKKFISKERFLCKFDKNGNQLVVIPLKHTFLSNDMIFTEDKLVFFKENEIVFYFK